MVEGLTTSAPDQGSGATDPASDPGNTTKSTISRLLRRPALDVCATVLPITIQQQDPGDTGGEAIPVPIPNTEVKLSSAEDTERAAFRENRSSPGFCASWTSIRSPESVRDDRRRLSSSGWRSDSPWASMEETATARS
jgi:hypothetical protein